jgi:hypothetical protein
VSRLRLPGDDEHDLRVELVLFCLSILGVTISALALF